MTRKRIARRIKYTLTPEERARVDWVRREVELEKDSLVAEARRDKRRSRALREACRMLRAERESQGLSLADLSKRTGITRSALCRLENDISPNPTVSTLQRYAEALGKEIVVSLANSKP
jgi:DNA-binding XRE family transcriptional regulator